MRCSWRSGKVPKARAQRPRGLGMRASLRQAKGIKQTSSPRRESTGPESKEQARDLTSSHVAAGTVRSKR